MDCAFEVTVDDGSTGFADESPGFADESPGFADESPAFADESPAFADESPALTVYVLPEGPLYTVSEVVEGYRPAALSMAVAAAASTVTDLVVCVPPPLVDVVAVVLVGVLAGMMALVRLFIPGVGVVVDPATVEPLGCPEPFPPASAA